MKCLGEEILTIFSAPRIMCFSPWKYIQSAFNGEEKLLLLRHSKDNA